MDNRTFGFLLITFAVCTTLTESFPRFLTRIPDDLSKSEESSEEESGSYSLETQQQQQVLKKVDQFPAQTTFAEQLGVIEQSGDNQFTFTSSGEQFTVEPGNSGTKQTEILFTGDHDMTAFETEKPTASDDTGTVVDRQSTSSSSNADTISDAVTSSSQFSTSLLTSDDSLSIAKFDSLAEKTATPFTENIERTTKNPNFESETPSTFDKTQSIPIEPSSTNSQFTTLKSVETTAGISFETSDKTTQKEISSTSEDKTKSHDTGTVTVSERSHKEDNRSSTLQPLTSSEDTSDRCDSTTFVKPTADSELTNAGKCGAFITDPTTPRTQFDMINTSTLSTASSEPEKQAAKDNDTILNNKSTFESNTGGTLGLSGSVPITETSENRKTTFSTGTGSQHLDQESITVSSESTILTSSSKSSIYQSSSSSPVNTIKEGSIISTASDDLSSTEVTESADVIFPDLLIKNEHTTDNQFLISPPLLSKHISKDADKILYELHTSNTTHNHLNHSDAGIPHNVLDEHTIHEQHDSPHTNLTGNLHQCTGGDEPLLPHSKHMHDSLYTKPTSSPQHIVGGDEPQIPHSHHMTTSHHTKPVGSPQHIVGGDEPQLPHSHHMKTFHHTSTGTLHRTIGGDEPKLPHSHHMNVTHHTNTSAKITGAVNQVIGVNESKLPDSSHEYASPHILRESITKKDPVNSTSHSTVGESVSGGNLSEQSEGEVQRFIDTENNERTTEQLLTESPNEDNLQRVHNDRSSDLSFISPVLFRNSKHASGMVLTETVPTDPIKSAVQTPLMDTSVADNIHQVSSDELIVVSDEQYPSENDEFPIRNHNSQGSEQPQESVADTQFSDKLIVLQEHITDNSNSSDKQIEISEDSSVQNQGRSSFTSSSVSSVTVKIEDTAQQDATFPSGDILPKKQANGDLQYFIEQVIYPKQIASDITNKHISNESTDIKTVQSTTIFSEPPVFESHSTPCNSTQTIDKPLFTQTNTTLADKQSKSTQSSASVTDFTTEKPTNIQSAEEHRFTISEILSTVPDDDDNNTPNHGAVLTDLAVQAVGKTVDSSSTVPNAPLSIDSTNQMTGSARSFQGDETAIPEFLVSSSIDNTQHSILDGKQTGNTVGYNSGSNYYSSAISTTMSTTSPSSASLNTTSTSPDVESTFSQGTTENPTSTSSTSGSTSSGTTSTYPDVETTSSQGTTENPTSTSSTSGSTSSGTTSTYPDVETTSSSMSSQGTTEDPTSSTSGSTSSDSTSTSSEETASSSMYSPSTTENPTSSTSSSTSSGTTSTSEEITASSSSSTSQGTTENPTFSTSSSTSSDTTSTSPMTETTSSSSSSQGTTKNPISSTSSSTSSGSTSTEIQSTTPDHYTKAPPYRLLAPESSVNMNTSLNRGYLATTNKQSIEHFQSIENTDKDNIFSPTLTSDQLTTSFQTSDSSEIKFERPPKPYIGIKHNSKGGDRSKMFYSKPWYYISEGRSLQNPFKNFKN